MTQSSATPTETPADYRATVHLPKTPFPMRARLPEREPERLAAWQANDLYGQIRRARAGAQQYILHDGPPYANGDIHLGTSLNKLLKDFVVKYQTMRGCDAPYVPGYDCHGLPIEFMVLQELGPKAAEMSKAELRALCRDYALSFVDSMSRDFQRLGVLGAWDDPYLTLSPTYEAGIVESFAELYHGGFITRGEKPILWCAHDRTALAEAEVEYADHTSPSVYVRFPIVSGFSAVPGDVNLIIWTTTPWTLPANRATCVHPDFEYVVARVGDEQVIVAEQLLPEYVSLANTTDSEVLAKFPGRDLEGAVYRHPLFDRECPVILGRHVTLEQGTGCVHTAPGHGHDDYIVGLQNGIEPFSPVDDDGRFTADVPEWQGVSVFDANGPIVERLRERGILVHREDIQHSYPHCWRCKQPLMFRNTPQWFISMDHDSLRARALEAIKTVQWVPSWGYDRFSGMLAQRPDWCVSRQRAWGVPITVFFCAGCEDVVCDKQISAHVANLVREHGVDVWFQRDAADLMPAGVQCPGCGGTTFTKEEDILDVWFESGSSFRAVLETREELRFPADLYLEGSDQHRGWFQSSLIAAMGTRGEPPYRAVVTHGYVVDAAGHKMSKSLGNFIPPQELLDKYGADILRLWVASENFQEDIRISDEILQRNADAYRTMRNTFRFLLGNLADYDQAAHPLRLEACDELDRYLLHRLTEVIDACTRDYDGFEYHNVLQTLTKFCGVDLSRLYMNVRKDRLYCAAADDPARRAAQAVMHVVLLSLTRLVAPILAFTADEVWELVSGPAGGSVHAADWPEAETAWSDPQLAERWGRILTARDAVMNALEPARAAKDIGSELEAAICVAITDDTTRAVVADLGDDFATLCIVSGAAVVDTPPATPGTLHRHEQDGVTVDVARAPGAKCDRCWHWTEDVGTHATHPALCRRCVAVIESQ